MQERIILPLLKEEYSRFDYEKDYIDIIFPFSPLSNL